MLNLHLWQAAHCTLHTAQCTLRTAPAHANTPEAEHVHFILHIEHLTLHITCLYCILQMYHFILKTLKKKCQSWFQDLHGKVYLDILPTKRKYPQLCMFSQVGILNPQLRIFQHIWAWGFLSHDNRVSEIITNSNWVKCFFLGYQIPNWRYYLSFPLVPISPCPALVDIAPGYVPWALL